MISESKSLNPVPEINTTYIWLLAISQHRFSNFQDENPISKSVSSYSRITSLQEKNEATPRARYPRRCHGCLAGRPLPRAVWSLDPFRAMHDREIMHPKGWFLCR